MTLLNEGLEAQATNLRDFGYSDVTFARVQAAYRKWKAGEELTDIIDKFCGSAFDDHPQIFGKRPK